MFGKRRAARRAFKADPLGRGGDDLDLKLAEIEDQQERQEVFVAEAFGEQAEETDPTGADLASVPDLPRGAVRSGDDVYAGGRRCQVCRVPATDDICVKCRIDGHEPSERERWSPDQLKKLLAAVFTCDFPGCGSMRGHDMICPVGGRSHASADDLVWMDAMPETGT